MELNKYMLSDRCGFLPWDPHSLSQVPAAQSQCFSSSDEAQRREVSCSPPHQLALALRPLPSLSVVEGGEAGPQGSSGLLSKLWLHDVSALGGH